MREGGGDLRDYINQFLISKWKSIFTYRPCAVHFVFSLPVFVLLRFDICFCVGMSEIRSGLWVLLPGSNYYYYYYFLLFPAMFRQSLVEAGLSFFCHAPVPVSVSIFVRFGVRAKGQSFCWKIFLVSVRRSDPVLILLLRTDFCTADFFGGVWFSAHRFVSCCPPSPRMPGVQFVWDRAACALLPVLFLLSLGKPSLRCCRATSDSACDSLRPSTQGQVFLAALVARGSLFIASLCISCWWTLIARKIVKVLSTFWLCVDRCRLKLVLFLSRWIKRLDVS
jgi:hypothetical protein